MKSMRLLLALTFLASAVSATNAAENVGKRDAAKPTAHTNRNVEGWTVRVDNRLLEGPNEQLGTRALKMLDEKLSDINVVVPPDKLKFMHTVTIVLDLSNGELNAMQYHPDADWLVEHGYDRALTHCVHIPTAEEMLETQMVNGQPWCVLHELSHAYHDQVLGFDEPRIRASYEKYKKSGHGESVLHISGNKTRHYALTDHKEFFAEMSEAYFGVNDFYPFNRAELMAAEPEIYHLLLDIWGPVETDAIKAKRRAKPSPAVPTP